MLLNNVLRKEAMKMKPIIFARVADMMFYQGITENDIPQHGGSYVEKTGDAMEAYNLDALNIDGIEKCLGFVQLMGGNGSKEQELHIENIVGCHNFKKDELINDVIVVWCSKANSSQNMRVVGFYIKAIAYRNTNKIEFIDCDEEDRKSTR